MAVPRARLRGPFGGPSMVPRNELAIDPILDAVSRGATGLIQNAYLRKRQKNQDAMAEQQRVEAANLAAQDRAERRETAQRDYDLRLRTFESGEQRERDRLQFERDKLAQPKEPNYRQMTDPVTGAVSNIDQGGVASPVMTRDGQPFRLGVPKKEPTAAQANASKGRPLPATAVQQLAMFDDLAQSARAIPEFLQQGKGNQTGAVVGRLPAFMRDFVAKGGIESRALISSIAGQYMSLISGAAVSPSEAARLAPFVPSDNDDEATVIRKATFFANRLQQIKNARIEAFKKAGYAFDGGTGEQPPEDVFDTYGLERRR